MAHSDGVIRLPLIESYLREQRDLTAVERFSRHHDTNHGASENSAERGYSELIPLSQPRPGEQFAFQVDMDRCTGCKACVTACHSLNGLDDQETWRFVGQLHGGSAREPLLQTVTTACHHCVEPACLSGCPVVAYEKDPITGIVKHLDDQCIGCQYCTMTCPYDVPQYNPKQGIVRKCDMCSDRLSAGQAPACVQACPNEAISIAIVSQAAALAVRDRAPDEGMLPGAPASAITAPTTQYVRSEPLPANTLPVDVHALRPSHFHWPLVVMSVLMQLAAGAFGWQWLLARALPAGLSPLLAAGALGVALLALNASLLHLGRPLYAFRAILGLRTSWMSREILVFGAFAGAAVLHTALAWRVQLAGWLGAPLEPVERIAPLLERASPALVVGSGAAGVFCSVMIYHVTRKRYWHVSSTGPKFFGSALLLGAVATLSALSAFASWQPSSLTEQAGRLVQQLLLLVPLLTLVKLAFELAILTQLRAAGPVELTRSARLMTGALRPLLLGRVALALLGGLLAPALALVLLAGGFGPAVTSLCALSLIALTLGELGERALFFGAVSSARMPGSLS
jgi:formate dehydrogenase iron-sulfur subunit